MSDASKIDDGGPAFPSVDMDSDGYKVEWTQERGISRRDYFAAAALTGAMTTATGLGTMGGDARRQLLGETAALIFEMADAMIAASKTGGHHG